MGKTAKRKVPFAASKAGLQQKENPFERQNSKRKFNVIGRKQFGAGKNLNQARSEAVERVRLVVPALTKRLCGAHKCAADHNPRYILRFIICLITFVCMLSGRSMHAPQQ